ncbi:transcription factor Tfb2 [Nitzschia inconspicua]|uniref:General transcription factor IIH subunit 4 n=1 Tax=Nitzschia inconspicua TaxID=303405 RepID=A0A9K3LWF4_9STRA|nr:transcription factor Tfb2 [Nitzschia inconspicua]
MGPTSPKRPLSPKGSADQLPSAKRVNHSNSPTPNASTTSTAISSTTADGGGGPKKKSKQQQVMAKTTGVMDYLQKSLSRPELLGLYKDPDRGRFVCRSVLQQVPELSQQIVVRLSCTGGVFPLAMIYSWFRSNTTPSLSPTEAAASHGRMIKLLEHLYQWAIIVDKPSSSTKKQDPNTTAGDNTTASANLVQLTPEFYQGFKNSLHSLDSSPWNPLTEKEMELIEEDAIKTSGKSNIKFPRMSNEDLERYTQAQWDAVLHYLVGTGNYADPHPAVAHFLLQTNLMQPDPDFKGKNTDDAPLVITQKGYDFMLQDNAQQVWHFIVQYMASMEENLSNDPAKAQLLKREALLVLICLSFARFGECYSGAGLTKEGRTIIKDLSLFGLLYTKKVGKTFIFYPTRIAMQLVGSEGTSNKAGGGGGMWSWSSKALENALAHPRPHDSSHLAIIVQTNFQLCAYTTSELHVSMLGLFCDVHTIRRLPNVIFMTISRDSIKGAFNLGIQAQQILRFLEKHAHPKLRESGTDPLPANVVDQIFLWDRERHRIRWNQVFNHQPIMPGEFQAVQKYAMELGAHGWSSEARNMIMIKYSFVDRIQNFVQKWRAKQASG